MKAYRMCALLWAAPMWAVPVFQVTAIGPAGTVSSATAISGTGVVVGNYQQPDGNYRGFLYQDGQVTTLTLPSGAVQTWASAVSNSGQAGGYVDTAQTAQGLIWDNLGNPVSTAGAYVMGMNGAGDGAGMAIGSDGAGVAFVTHNGVLTNLGQPGGGDWSSAYAINSAGVAAGSAMTADGNFRGFTGSAGGGSTLLGTLGGQNSNARAINDAGVAAGSAQTGTGATVAAYWNGSTAVGIGTLGGLNSYAYAINSSGQMAGYSELAGTGGTAAFLFDNGVMYDLNGLLAPGSTWQLLAAYGMNDRGQIIGRGLLDGVEQAFLLTPETAGVGKSQATSEPSGPGVPEPGTIWLIGPPILLYFALRSR